MSEERRYGRRDQFLDAASFDPERARELAERLEMLHASDAERAHRARYLDLLDVGPGKRVLEVGCGNGVVLREIARRVGPSGRAVGVDASGELVGIARQQATRDGLDVELHQGDARDLRLPAEAFDVALAPLLLLHVAEAERVVSELVRVVRAGGKVGVLERDNESFVVSHPDREITRRIIQVGTDQTAINAWVGRRLPGMLRRAGLEGVQIEPFVSIDRESTGSVVRYILRWSEVAVDLGAISPVERQRWLDQLYEEESAGGFLVAVTHFFAFGTRPKTV